MTSAVDFAELVNDLVSQAGRRLSAHASPFQTTNGGAGGFTCPWLEFWKRLHVGSWPKGILLLQDWNRISESDVAAGRIPALVDELKYLGNGFGGSSDGIDTTTRNVLQSGWKGAFLSGSWLIMNAVWGLPFDEGVCGYLGRPVHVAAHSLWRPIVEASAREHASFVLVTAGSWSRFSQEKTDGPQHLDAYLHKWGRWIDRASSKEAAVVRGTHYYVSHPSTWRTSGAFDLRDGPPTIG